MSVTPTTRRKSSSGTTDAESHVLVLESDGLEPVLGAVLRVVRFGLGVRGGHVGGGGALHALGLGLGRRVVQRDDARGELELGLVENFEALAGLELQPDRVLGEHGAAVARKQRAVGVRVPRVVVDDVERGRGRHGVKKPGA